MKGNENKTYQNFQNMNKVMLKGKCTAVKLI